MDLRTICAILEEGIIRNNPVKSFWNLDQWFRRKCGLKVFLIWSSGSHFVQRSITICPILVERRYQEEQFCEIILNLSQWFRRRCLLIDFLSGALVTLLFSGEEPFMQFWKRASWGTFMWSYMKLGPVVQEEMSFKEKVNGLTMDRRQTKIDINTSPWAFGSDELKNGAQCLKSTCCFRQPPLSNSS